MLIGRFTERPYQDPSSGYFGATGRSIQDLSISNGEYDPQLGSELYNRYLDEQVAAEEAGFDAIMLNEHHSTPFCMGGTVNTRLSPRVNTLVCCRIGSQRLVSIRQIMGRTPYDELRPH